LPQCGSTNCLTTLSSAGLRHERLISGGMKLVPSDIYPAVRQFLLDNELSRTLKVLDKETSTLEDLPVVKPKKARAIADLELVTACKLNLGQALRPSDIHPVLRQFLVENGLTRTLKAFDKETSALEDLPVVKPKKARAIAELELVACCQHWLTEALSKGKEAAVEAVEAPKRKAAEPAEAKAEEQAPKPSKKRKAAEPAEAEAEEQVAPPPKKAKKAKKEETEEKKSGVPFKRIDDDAWRSKIKDSRLLDNTHIGKAKYGGSEGDSWADKASEDLLKVKGKGFRKEMQKKKRASWRGGGSIDQGVNSIKFSDSEDE